MPSCSFCGYYSTILYRQANDLGLVVPFHYQGGYMDNQHFSKYYPYEADNKLEILC